MFPDHHDVLACIDLEETALSALPTSEEAEAREKRVLASIDFPHLVDRLMGKRVLVGQRIECPVATHSKPTCTIYDKGVYCFSCVEGHNYFDSIALVQHYFSLSRHDAVDWLVQQYAIDTTPVVSVKGDVTDDTCHGTRLTSRSTRNRRNRVVYMK